MRLAKVNILRSGASTNSSGQKHPTSLNFSTDRNVVGVFWYIKEELDDNEARKIARSKQANGHRGNIFHGSAESVWQKGDSRRSHNYTTKRENVKAETWPETFAGRSYGLLSDEEEDEEGVNDGPDPMDHQPSSQQSYLSSTTQQDPLSPPLSPSPNRESLNATPRKREDRTPPMPGSFVFEEDAPASPSFSSSLTESTQNVTDFLYSTPARPSYINPGLALESRYDSSSSLPQHSRFDMTPRQLAAFSRRKQEFERLMERPSTPSVMSDTGVHEWEISDKDRAERERRRKDLQRFRLERQKRQRLENRSESQGGKEPSRKRPRRSFELVDSGPLVEQVPSKRSRSSELFARALDRETRATFKSPENERPVHDSSLLLPATDEISHSLRESEAPASAYSAPTPSPSPPLLSEPTVSKHAQLHMPKKPSGLRRAVNISSSPSTSPMRGNQNPGKLHSRFVSEDAANICRLAVNTFERSSLLTYDFPPLNPSLASQARPEIVRELNNYLESLVPKVSPV
ncbi:hypothetical protein TWF970_009900 [Orbilia oligospora]|uniref:Uncharacterized protein n=1 Tax=Orbilia oligospora TaxID=2813651 RepID=A0A7C8R4R9_ORBOL|nr:hypothetical protein TWF970_009900 [Orbilia oligospora]